MTLHHGVSEVIMAEEEKTLVHVGVCVLRRKRQLSHVSSSLLACPLSEEGACDSHLKTINTAIRQNDQQIE